MRHTRPTIISFLFGLLAVPIPYFSLLLDSRLALTYRDLTNVQIPYRALWLRAVEELGRVPHWDPLHFSGTPFLVDPNYGPLYPLNALFLLFTPDSVARGMVYFIVLHHLLLYVGSFLLLRSLPVRPILAAIGGLAITWSGYAMSCDNIPNLLASASAIPFFFFAWRKALRPGWNFWLPFAALALAWPIYAGDPQFTYVAALTGLLFFTKRIGVQFFSKYASLGALTICAAGPQLFPTFTYLQSIDRNLPWITADFQMAWSLHPMRMLEAIFPLMFGRFPELNDFWGSAFVNHQSPHPPFIYSLHLGIIPLSFCLLFLLPAMSKSGRRRRYLPWIFATCAAIFLSMGIFSPIPFYRWFYKVLPLWSSFRYPERLSFWFCLPILIFSCMSAERWLRLSSITKNWRNLLPLALPLLAAFPVSLWVYRQGHSAAPILQSALLLICTFATLTLPENWKKVSTLLLTAFFLLHTARVANHLVWPQPTALMAIENHPKVKKILQDQVTEALEISQGAANRVYAFESAVATQPPPVALSPMLPLTTEAYQAYALLRANTPTYWNLEMMSGYASLMPNPRPMFFDNDPTEMKRRRLNLESVRYIVFPNENGEPNIGVNQNALPYIHFPKEVRRLETSNAIQALLLQESFSPQITTIIETKEDIPQKPGLWTIKRLKKTWDKIDIELSAKLDSQQGWLLVNESFNKNWKARNTKDGNAINIFRANGWAMALPLPSKSAGASLDIELTYREPSFYWGLLAFMVWLLSLPTLIGLGHIKRRNR